MLEYNSKPCGEYQTKAHNEALMTDVKEAKIKEIQQFQQSSQESIQQKK